MQVAERPKAPVPGETDHQSIELIWEDTMQLISHAFNSSSGPLVQATVCLQCQDKSGQWSNIYVGYASRHVMKGLEPLTNYCFRIRFGANNRFTDWSPTCTVSTAKEPVSGFQLHKAVLANDRVGVEQVLQEAGLKIVDIFDKYGLSPLMQASQKGLLSIMDLLLDYGASPNLQNDAGKTSLMLASFYGQLDAIELLVQRGARVDLVDAGGSQALHWAVDNGHAKAIYLLVKLKANVNAVDNHGWAPLMRCTIIGGHADAARALLKCGANPNLKDFDGKTALMTAITNNHSDIVELLVDAGADLTITNASGKTAWDFAVAMERRIIMRILDPRVKRS